MRRPLRRLLPALLLVIAASPFSRSLAEGPGLRGHGGPVRALVVMDGERIASAGFDSAIIIWNVAGGRAERVLRFHDGTVNALARTGTGCLVSAGEDARVATWCGTLDKPSRVDTGHTAPVSSLAVAADGRTLASAGWDRTVRLSAADGAGRVVARHAAPVTGVAFTRDGSAVVSASFDGEVRAAPLDGGAPRTAKWSVSINGLAPTPDGQFLLAGADGVVREIDDALQLRREMPLPDGPLMAVAVSPDGRHVAAGGMRTPVTLIERDTGLPKAVVLGPGLPLWSLAFSADGRELYSGGADRAVRRFEVATGRPVEVTAEGVSERAPEDATSHGARVFRACRACHGLTAADTNLAGPTLHAIMGRRIASLPGYAFSEPLKAMSIVWTPETIARLFEVGPQAFTPGTKMPEQRLTDPDDRRALVEWLARVTAP